jgi:enoyl-[acyl-carrier protein] reductase II
LHNIFKSSSLKQAALDGDVENGKLEAGQSAGLIDDILPAAELMRRLVAETEVARKRLLEL